MSDQATTAKFTLARLFGTRPAPTRPASSSSSGAGAGGLKNDGSTHRDDTENTFSSVSQQEHERQYEQQQQSQQRQGHQRRRRWAPRVAVAVTLIGVVMLITFLALPPMGNRSAASASDNEGSGGVEDTTGLIDGFDYIVNATQLKAASGQTIWLETCSPRKLCGLWLIPPTKWTTRKHNYYPIARSYDGHIWEAQAGPYANAVRIQCQRRFGNIAAGNERCQIKLPTKPNIKYTYQITESEHSRVVSPREIAARFLEQTTFGPTVAEINALGGKRFNAATSLAEWVRKQMKGIPYGSHRQFYRRNMNHRYEVPTTQGVVTTACQAGTVYRKYAVTDKDYLRTVEIRTPAVAGAARKLLYVDGQFRTYVSAKGLYLGDRSRGPYLGRRVEFIDGFYKMCKLPTNDDHHLWNGVGADFNLYHPGFRRCGAVFADRGEKNPNGSIKLELLGIPAVSFDVAAAAKQGNTRYPVIWLNDYAARLDDDHVILKKDAAHPHCSAVADVTGFPAQQTVFGIFGSIKDVYLHDPRWVLKYNAVDKPMLDGGDSVVQATSLTTSNKKTTTRSSSSSKAALLSSSVSSSSPSKALCSNVPMNFVNEGQCVLSRKNDICSFREQYDVENGGITIELNPTNLEILYSLTAGEGGAGGGAAAKSSETTRYVYAVRGLRQGGNHKTPYDPPCKVGSVSRWIPVDHCHSAGGVTAAPQTKIAFAKLLRESTDNENPYLRDIVFQSNNKLKCHPNDMNKYGFTVPVTGGQCWRNVHRSHLQVYDFTSWVRNHPGGPDAITQFAVQESDDKSDGGGSSFILTFPDWHAMDRWYGPTAKRNRIELGRLGDIVQLRDLPNPLQSRQVIEAFGQPVSEIWPGAQVVCGSPDEVANVRNFPTTRDYLSGNTFDSATYRNRTSIGLERQRTMTWMEKALYGNDQLRQRVAWALSQILVVSPDSGGPRIQTEVWTAYYDIFVRHAFGNYFDILKEVSFHPLMAQMLSFLNNRAIAWTWNRFNRLEYPDENYAREIMQLFTIGMYELNNNGTNVLDVTTGHPIRTYGNEEITEYSRAWTGFERQPKRGNIEDSLLAPFNNLDPMKITIRYRDHMPKLGLDDQYIGDGLPLCADLPHRHFLKMGATYRLLGSIPKPVMHQEPSSWATDPDVIRVRLEARSELRKRLCNRKTSGIGAGKCQYDVKVVLDKHVPCVGVECDIEAPRVVEVEDGLFYEYIRMPCVHQAFYTRGRTMRNSRAEYSCGDPRVAIGAPACCDSSSSPVADRSYEIFHGEWVKFAEAERRCAKDGKVVCTNPILPGGCDDVECMGISDFWSSSPCRTKAKIDIEGNVAIVHGNSANERIHPSVRQDTKSFFRVQWNSNIKGFLANYRRECINQGCQFTPEDGYCLCPVTVFETQGFNIRPTREEVLSELYVGAFDPSTYGGKNKVTKDLGNGVKLHSADGTYRRDSVFEVVDDNGLKRFRRNMKSLVLAGTRTGAPLTFRNPLHVIHFVNPESRDAYYETDAALEHYFYHRNTAPFLAIRFAQRFGISNPSPRYVDEISTAFRTGTYVHEPSGIRFGQGKYGDLSSTIAAVILDREARSVRLDADPSHGSLHEPFLKLVRMMRSLEFKPDHDKRFIDFQLDLQDAIGQECHKHPDVFSFFRPEFQPQDPIDMPLTCPECQILTSPRAISLNNGLSSLAKYGFDSAYGGFGRPRKAALSGWEKREQGEFREYATGHLTYKPRDGATAAQVVDELALLLTSGRLSKNKRRIMEEVYKDSLAQHSDPLLARINVQQLIAATPEFHSNGLSRSTGQARQLPNPPQPSNRPYRAVIYIMLAGGYDSFNLVVPQVCHGKNRAGVSVDKQYRQERGILAFRPGKERRTRINVKNQPCSVFAIHDEMKLVKELYDDGDLLFFANTGVINDAGMNKDNWDRKTKSQLFAHNTMQEETKMVDPFQNAPGTGVLGRLSEVLTDKGFRTSSISIDDLSIAISPEPEEAPAPLTVSRFGAAAFNDRPPHEQSFDAEKYVHRLNTEAEKYSSLFGEAWARQFTSGIREARWLKNALDEVEMGNHWSKEPGTIGKRLQEIARLIIARKDRGTDRDFFYAQDDKYDHHSDLKRNLRERFSGLNEALSHLVKELKNQGVWNDVTVVVTSEFGRTLTPNGSQGSDHGWGGNYFMMGGSVAGGKMLGKFPKDFTATSPLTIGRGRFIPTTSWDCVWNGVSQWMGAQTEKDLDRCLPNRHKATVATDDQFTKLFTQRDLYNTQS